MGNLFGKERKLIIMRGVPGSGKSTLAKQLTVDYGVVYATDDFFMDTGEYKFDASHLRDANIWNQGRTKAAMEKGEPLIVIDNNNVKRWEARPYVELGIKYGYTIVFQTVDTQWKTSLEELVRRNKRGSSADIIQRLIDQWDDDFTIESVLQSKAPWE
jgi:predicted kinase